MSSGKPFPLVSAMLAQVYNNSFLGTHPRHEDLTEVNVMQFLGVAFHQKHYPIGMALVVLAENLLVQRPELAEELWDGRPSGMADPILEQVANSYCESIGLI